MIVDTLMKDMIWTPTGVRCPDNLTGKVIYQFLSELILDSHLYVTKPIGFHVENKTQRNHAGTYIARNVQIGESYAEMMVNLSDKVFIDTTDPIIRFEGKSGVVTCDAIPATVLRIKDYVCRVTDGTCNILFKLCTGCGYMSMEDTSAQIDSKFFPMNTYFNISDYVRVIPSMGDFTFIPMRYYHDMTVDTLKGMILKYMGMLQSENISEEEAAWVYSFEL